MTAASPSTSFDEFDEQTWQTRLTFAGRLLRRDRGGLLGAILFVLIVFTAIFAPVIAPHDPLKQNLRAAKQPPAWQEGGSWEYPLGTDPLGRDMLSRIIYGTRVSLTVGFFGVLIAGTLGLVAGLVAGYLGGWVDGIIMAVVNVFWLSPIWYLWL